MKKFASRLRADRERACLTVRQLADQSGISFSYITKIETGRAGKGISPEIIGALARTLDVDVLEYLNLSEIVPPPLNDLLSNERSRLFVRELLDSHLKHDGWDCLFQALANSQGGKQASQTKMADDGTKKSRRKSVA